MKLYLLLTFILLTNIGFSQNPIDSRITEVYTSEYIQTLSQDRIRLLEYELDHSYFIIDNFEASDTIILKMKFHHVSPPHKSQSK